MNQPQDLMLHLYTTSACHLCELAEGMLYALNIPVKAVEIVEDDALLTRYATRIPVLKRLDTQAELNWPFSKADLLLFLQ